MKRHLALVSLSLTVLATVAHAGVHPGQPNLLGRWKIQLTDAVRDMSKRLGVPEPVAEFTFLPDQTFTYLTKQGSQELVKKGKYSLDGDQVKLEAPDWPASAALQGDLLAYNGFSFTRQIDFNAVGEWVLSRNGLVDSGIRASFKKDGTFEFRCSNAISKGRYEIDGREIHLVWTEVDGDKVALGSMQKRLSIDSDGFGFSVDQWHYVRKA